MDPNEINTFSSDIEFNVTSDGELLLNTTEIELGKRVEINFISLSNMTNFYIENCTAMNSESVEVAANTLPLVEPGFHISMSFFVIISKQYI